MERPSDIGEDECWELLAMANVGRIALSVRALPAILPVQYYLEGRTLAVCLGQHELPPASVDRTVIAFAADAIDASSRSGWSVQVQGIAHAPGTEGAPPACGQPAGGQVVHVKPVTLSGHRITLCPFLGGP